MNEINFLPNSILEEQKRLQRRVREVIAVLLVIVSVAVWYMTTRNTLSILEEQLASLKSELTADQEQDRELIALQVEYASLAADARTQRLLTIPVETLDIIKIISTVMPQTIAISDFGLRTPPPLNQSTDKSVRTVQMHLVGIAPDDVIVADFVEGLSKYPMFDNVKMLYSRSSRIGDGKQREFRIEMEVPLDRNYRQASAAKEANHAG